MLEAVELADVVADDVPVEVCEEVIDDVCVLEAVELADVVTLVVTVVNRVDVCVDVAVVSASEFLRCRSTVVEDGMVVALQAYPDQVASGYAPMLPLNTASKPGPHSSISPA